MEGLIQGGSGFTIPGGVQGKTACGTSCHGRVARMVFSHKLVLMSEIFSNLVDSVLAEPMAGRVVPAAWVPSSLLAPAHKDALPGKQC